MELLDLYSDSMFIWGIYRGGGIYIFKQRMPFTIVMTSHNIQQTQTYNPHNTREW